MESDGVYTRCMHRTQLYLTHEQRRRLAAIAKTAGTSMAEVVREAVEQYLSARAPTADDGLFKLIGAAGDLETATDVSANHHKYLRYAHWEHPDR